MFVKSAQYLLESDEAYHVQGSVLVRYLSGVNSNTFKNVLLLIISNLDFILLFTILISGVNKVDMYHLLFLLMFVCYVIYPDKHLKITLFVVVYSELFIILKYIYSLLVRDNDKPDSNDLLL